MSRPQWKHVTRIDGERHLSVLKAQCPCCGQWADIDEDQFHGRVSMLCATAGCSFHETHDLSGTEPVR